MGDIMKGRYLELIDESNNRIIFSAAIPSLEKDMFLKLWEQLGIMLYEKQNVEQSSYFRLRMSGIQIF